MCPPIRRAWYSPEPNVARATMSGPGDGWPVDSGARCRDDAALGSDDEVGADMAKSANDLVAAAKSEIENLGVDAVEEELRSGKAVLVDLREADELAANGRIPGSVHVPRGMLEFRADPTSSYHSEQLDPSKRVILHCAGGGRSALGVQTLRSMGYTDVAHLDGGFTAWKDAGKSVE
jgi:rhodanese-related sulfurtransferase